GARPSSEPAGPAAPQGAPELVGERGATSAAREHPAADGSAAPPPTATDAAAPRRPRAGARAAADDGTLPAEPPRSQPVRGSRHDARRGHAPSDEPPPRLARRTARAPAAPLRRDLDAARARRARDRRAHRPASGRGRL